MQAMELGRPKVLCEMQACRASVPRRRLNTAARHAGVTEAGTRAPSLSPYLVHPTPPSPLNTMSGDPPLPHWAVSKQVTAVPHMVDGCEKKHVPHFHPHDTPSPAAAHAGEGTAEASQLPVGAPPAPAPKSSLASLDELLDKPVRGTGAADKQLAAPEDIGPTVAQSAADTRLTHKGLEAAPVKSSAAATAGGRGGPGKGTGSGTGSGGVDKA